MNKRTKIAFIAGAAAVLTLLFYRMAFIRTVNYEIAGVKIPSTYNTLTGKIRPIPDYKGTSNLPSVTPSQKSGIGLSQDQITMARFRWALFSQWAAQHPEYKGWDGDPEVFTKARTAFKEYMKKFKGSVAVI